MYPPPPFERAGILRVQCFHSRHTSGTRPATRGYEKSGASRWRDTRGTFRHRAVSSFRSRCSVAFVPEAGGLGSQHRGREPPPLPSRLRASRDIDDPVVMWCCLILRTLRAFTGSMRRKPANAFAIVTAPGEPVATLAKSQRFRRIFALLPSAHGAVISGHCRRCARALAR